MEFGGQRNGTPSGVCVGNGFIRSETLDILNGLLNGNFPRHIFVVFPINAPVLKQQSSECINAFPTNHPEFSHSIGLWKAENRKLPFSLFNLSPPGGNPGVGGNYIAISSFSLAAVALSTFLIYLSSRSCRSFSAFFWSSSVISEFFFSFFT